MTRAEVAAMFSNLLLEHPDGQQDVLAGLEMIRGYEDGTFRPDDPISRAEFTAIAMRFSKGSIAGKNLFSDVFPGDWCYDVVMGSIQYSWIGGYEDGTFRPYNHITRAEVTAITNRMLGREGDRQSIDRQKNKLSTFSDLTGSYWGYYSIMEATNAHDYKKVNGHEHWTALKD